MSSASGLLICWAFKYPKRGLQGDGVGFDGLRLCVAKGNKTPVQFLGDLCGRGNCAGRRDLQTIFHCFALYAVIAVYAVYSVYNIQHYIALSSIKVTKNG